MNFLKVYQIYFENEQLALCEPEYTAILNLECTGYFENSIIKHLVRQGAHLDSEYFGVVSYKLREKIGSVMKERWARMNIANASAASFSPLYFEDVLHCARPDAMSFQQHMPHDPVLTAERFHPGFRKYWEKIMQEIGMDWKPTYLSDVFYCNYFVAKSKVYEDYVHDMLRPAMSVMCSMPELWGNSGYPHKLPENLAAKWGTSHYPYHPFLCERLFSWYAHVNNLNCKHY